MKIRFKHQEYQRQAVAAVVDCFKGQPNLSDIRYRLDPGHRTQGEMFAEAGFRNADLQLTETELLANLRKVQNEQNLILDSELEKSPVCPVNLDVEMETGTGKTYVYIRTIYELNRLYGWSKFIIVVPSIAIREGVAKAFEITEEHFLEDYGKRIRYFIYDSSQLHNLEAFSSDASINVMIINTQAFNATGKDARKIYEELDSFQSRRPIDVIKRNRPILIIDEPQKIEGDEKKPSKSLLALKEFEPLFILRYSATFKKTYNKVYRLDALDAYNQKLVKKISVRGISIKGLPGTNVYLYLDSIEISRQDPLARMEIEIKTKSGISRTVRKLKKGENLYDLSGRLTQYKNFVVSEIDGLHGSVSFTNGVEINSGEATGDVSEAVLRRIQIREAIRAHFEKEKILFSRGIKVLTLFFIDEVAKYRSYSDAGEEPGEYASAFEEEYRAYLADRELPFDPEYAAYLDEIDVKSTHNGYFSIDKNKHLVNSKQNRATKETDDVDAYDLILKDKERLLSLEEPTRFIFSHSALREGWDNPNVFVICTLKHSDNTVTRRQEVGRGLRLAVNHQGERQDHPATVHQINRLTVVANESYGDFVSTLQKEISESLSTRPRFATREYFTGRFIRTDDGIMEVTAEMAGHLEFYLIKNDYVDTDRRVTDHYREMQSSGTLAPLPDNLAPYSQELFRLINSVFDGTQLPEIENDKNTRYIKLNKNFHKKEFQELWSRINHKAVYSVDFESSELIRKSIAAINRELQVTPLQYRIEGGEQKDTVSQDDLRTGSGFEAKNTSVQYNQGSIVSRVSYDLIGQISEATLTMRKTVGQILSGIEKNRFAQFAMNPEQFIGQVSRLIQEQKATAILERLSYNIIEDTYDNDIFTENQLTLDADRVIGPLRRHIYDYLMSDSQLERQFAGGMDAGNEIEVYAKLPRGFSIPTPVGDYNPDWAIAFKEGTVRHVYFVAETKGSMSSLQLRAIEEQKIECARKFFAKLNANFSNQGVRFSVVTDYAKLIDLVKGA